MKKLNTCYIFGAAPASREDIMYFDLCEQDTVICADGGYALACECGVKPNWVVGDFDSSNDPEEIPNLIRVKPEKDDTDMELAVAQGIKLGYRNFVIYGALGGRYDHAFANIQLLGRLIEQGISARLVNRQNLIYMIKDRTETLDRIENFPYVSLFSFSERCEGITLKNMKYPLSDAVLTNTSAGLGVSNEMLENTAEITVKKGTLLIMRSRDRKSRTQHCR